MEPVELERVETPRSHLFLVRVWRELLDSEHAEWRGKVHAAMTGQELYFRNWAGLVTAIGKLLDAPPETAAPPASPADASLEAEGDEP